MSIVMDTSHNTKGDIIFDAKRAMGQWKIANRLWMMQNLKI
jgi:hypothetical protein